jgi:hypothetical protein
MMMVSTSHMAMRNIIATAVTTWGLVDEEL